jgi:hypothetical protein
LLAVPALSTEDDALAIEANILGRHLPFGGIIDPVYAAYGSTTIAGYSRCADSALWTGAWLAAESFHYAVDQSPAACSPLTGSSRPGIESEEAANTIHMAPPWVWVDNTSRDEVVGVFLGLATAYDFVNDAGVHASIGPIASLIARYISDHLWSPGDDITTTFLVRPEELQMLLDTARHVDPGDNISGPFLNPVPFEAGVLLDRATASISMPTWTSATIPPATRTRSSI